MKNIIRQLKWVHLMHLLPILSVLVAQYKQYLGNFWGIYLPIFFFIQWVIWLLDGKVERFLQNPKTLKILCIAVLILGGYYIITGLNVGLIVRIYLGCTFIFSSLCFLIAELIRKK